MIAESSRPGVKPDRSERSGAFPLERALRRAGSRGRSTSLTTSPSTLTPPCAISRRASLVEPSPSRSTSTAGRCTGSPSGSGSSGTSSGAWPSRTTRVKWSSAWRAASSPCERSTMNRARASFASSGSLRRQLPLPDEPVPLGQQLVGHAHRAAEHLLRRRGQRDVVPERRAHLVAVPRDEDRRRQRDLRLEPVGLHHLAAGEQVVELVGAAELDVGLDRDRVVGLHQRVEQLGDRDRLRAEV